MYKAMLYSARAQGAPAARPPLCSRRAGGETHGLLSVVGVQVEVEEDVVVVVVAHGLRQRSHEGTQARIANGTQRVARGQDALRTACVEGMHCSRHARV